MTSARESEIRHRVSRMERLQGIAYSEGQIQREMLGEIDALRAENEELKKSLDLDNNRIFIINSRTDVVELANRLKRACEVLRGSSNLEGSDYLVELADELEAPLGELDK